MHVIMQIFLRRRGKFLQKDRKVMFDPYFTKIIKSCWDAFSEEDDKLHFDWGNNMKTYVTGKSKGKNHKLELGRDVDMVYAPMNWGSMHWVGLCIDLWTSHVTILDSCIHVSKTVEEYDAHMASVLSSLPYILEQYVGYNIYQTKEGVQFYSWSRFEGIYHNERSGDCGPCTATFIEMHADGLG